MSAPIRMQIAIAGTLVAEVIVESDMADRTWAHYTQAKYRRGLPAGGAVLKRADLPREWDVPVGSAITTREALLNLESLA